MKKYIITMFKKTTLFLVASAALAGSARAAITDSICDYLDALNTCGDTPPVKRRVTPRRTAATLAVCA